MLDFGGVKLPLLRLDARPLDGEAVGVQTGIGQQLNVLLVPIIMVTGKAAGLGEARVGQLLLRPVIAVEVVAFHLMGSRGRTDKKAFFKFLHGGSPSYKIRGLLLQEPCGPVSSGGRRALVSVLTA